MTAASERTNSVACPQVVSLRGGLVAVALWLCVSGPLLAQENAPRLPPAATLRVEKIISLLTNPTPVMQPTWSPEGRGLAFARTGYEGIEMVRADGTERRTLLVAPGAGYRFTWSPDGQWIAARVTVEQNGQRRFEVRLVEVATGRVRVAIPAVADLQPPQWERGESGYRVVALAAGRKLQGEWHSHKFPGAAAGRSEALVYYRDGNLWLYPPGEGEHRPLTHGGGLNPVCSPDRKWIAYSRGDTLMIMNPEGTIQRALGEGHHPSWSPDGDKLVFAQMTDDGHQITGSDLYVIQVDGTGLTRLTDTPDRLEVEPAWSPDGRRIAYRLEDRGEIALVILTW